MLTLEIEFLTGVCFAAKPQQSPTSEPDWPPQPDRVFSALVAAWAVRGERPEERRALEWLEQQPAPAIHASDFYARRVGIAFVPPNDMRNDDHTMPDRRRRQARLFPAAIPDRPLLRFEWRQSPGGEAVNALQALARDTAYLGHSASVVRCAFVSEPAEDAELKPRRPERWVYPGRLGLLQDAFQRQQRPPLGEQVLDWSPENQERTPESVFGTNWIVLEDLGGSCPDLRGIALAARRFRDALMASYGEAGLAVPNFISGHQPDGSPLTVPHMAIIPMSDVGTHYSSGRLMGLALVLPREMESVRLRAEKDWLAGLADASEEVQLWRTFDQIISNVGELRFGSSGEWQIGRTFGSNKFSLKPERYTRASRRWSTVTPIAIDRYPKGKTLAEREAETCDSISAACVNTGLPEPSSIRVYKHAAVKSAPSAYPSGRSPTWMRWALPGAMANRVLTHAVIEFSQPVRGPVILGAGRFAGLGLCLGSEQ